MPPFYPMIVAAIRFHQELTGKEVRRMSRALECGLCLPVTTNRRQRTNKIRTAVKKSRGFLGMHVRCCSVICHVCDLLQAYFKICAEKY